MAIESIIRYHRNVKGENGEVRSVTNFVFYRSSVENLVKRNFAVKVCRMGKYHNILYIGVRIAWNWNVTHSQTICILLSKTFAGSNFKL